MSIRKIATFFGWPLLVLPTALVYFGIGLNAICTVANKGVMPVRTSNCDEIFNADAPDPVHACETPKSHVKFLSDIIAEGDGIVSIGDEFIDIGQTIEKKCTWLWGTIALFCLIRRKEFYWE